VKKFSIFIFSFVATKKKMISPPPTILTLGSEDIKEYENIKKSWPTIKENTKGGQSWKKESDAAALHKKEVHERIGFAPKK
jgi:hypothetical protein